MRRRNSAANATATRTPIPPPTNTSVVNPRTPWHVYSARETAILIRKVGDAARGAVRLGADEVCCVHTTAGTRPFHRNEVLRRSNNVAKIALARSEAPDDGLTTWSTAAHWRSTVIQTTNGEKERFVPEAARNVQSSLCFSAVVSFCACIVAREGKRERESCAAISTVGKRRLGCCEFC